MKLRYEKPMIEVENYELSTSIASNCKNVVTMGPEYEDHAPCKDYYLHAGEDFPGNKARSIYNVDFWENCDCYTGASGIYFTS